ncbi:hypothetical protein GPJ56_009314 [Histomonas meleagridis]|uniref:uncharacterized protein n=1 Tax=Histomonas meleagridis TaxID=135588 RepID=UPI00355995B1|nr:hypothetical protein GPJ56_009314 [Histomonas meleagridis]KAH0797727.1 hypothetical protein GO595_009356 [Histomonas meleagridis]
MISKEDFKLLQEKLVSLSEQSEEYQAKINELKEQNSQIPSLQNKMKEMTKENEKEEERQMKELQDASAKLNQLRSDSKKSIFDLSERKIQKLENKIKILRKKFEDLMKTEDELNATNDENRKQIHVIKQDAESLQTQINKFEKLCLRVPPSAPILLQITDLETSYSQLRNLHQQNSSRIPILETQISDLTSEVQLKGSQYYRLKGDLDSIQSNIDKSKSSKSELISTLQNISGQLEEDGIANKSENLRAIEERKRNESLEESEKSDVSQLEASLLSLKEKETDFSNDISALKSDHAKVILKKKQMIDQLNKKMKETKHEIEEAQSNNPEVFQLTSDLEKEWIEHEQLLDIYKDKCSVLEKKKELLRRRKIAIAEIRNRWPPDGRVKAKKGMPELCCIYEEALVMNRKLAGDVNSLNGEIEIYREMNTKLKKELKIAD